MPLLDSIISNLYDNTLFHHNMAFDNEFRIKLVNRIEKHLEYTSKSDIGIVLAGIPYQTENKAEFFLGYEVGYLRCDLLTLFILQYDRNMNSDESLELDELINTHAFSKLKVIMTGI